MNKLAQDTITAIKSRPLEFDMHAWPSCILGFAVQQMNSELITASHGYDIVSPPTKKLHFH